MKKIIFLLSIIILQSCGINSPTQTRKGWVNQNLQNWDVPTPEDLDIIWVRDTIVPDVYPAILNHKDTVLITQYPNQFTYCPKYGHCTHFFKEGDKWTTVDNIYYRKYQSFTKVLFVNDSTLIQFKLIENEK